LTEELGQQPESVRVTQHSQSCLC